MKKVSILIDTEQKIRKLIAILEREEIMADLEQGNICINARSMVGIMTLAPRDPIILRIRETDEVAEQIVEMLGEFIIQ